LAAVGSTLYFRAYDPTHGIELWKSNGAAAGTELVKDIYPGGDSYPNELTVVGKTLYFSAYGPTHEFGLWKLVS
jgi:ELWxxDGT repeat protein